MNFLKKCAAVLLAAAMMLSFAACSSDTAWIMRKGELEMPAGVYLNSMMESFYNALFLAQDSSKDLLKQQIEGKDGSEWIKEQALNITKVNMAVCNKFNELGLSFTADELQTCYTQAEAYYETNGENLEKNGISKNSIELLYQIEYMKAKVFDAIYGMGGEREVSEEELRDYYNENYIKIAVQTFNLPSEPTFAEDATEEEKVTQQQVYEMSLNSVVSESENLYLQGQIGNDSGKDWNDVLNNYKALNQSEDAGEYDMTTNNYRLLDTSTTALDAEIVTALKEAELGKVVKVRTDSLIAVGARTDIDSDPTDFLYVESMILHALKDEEFESVMLEEANGEGFVVNEKAVDRYKPSKIKFS